MVVFLGGGILGEGFKVLQFLIWLKTSATIARLDYAPQHELIAYGWYGTHLFYKPTDKSILICPKPRKSSNHPTTKPINLIQRLILNSTSNGDIVYDGFLGSGTCLFACDVVRRVCVGIEIDPEYCQSIIDRWEKKTGSRAVYKT